MLLESVQYCEYNHGSGNPWDLLELNLQQKNLIVGKNAAGKSRTVNLIASLGAFIGNAPLRYEDCQWQLQWKRSDGSTFCYELEVLNGSITKEKISIGDKVKLDRTTDKTTLYSETNKKDETISPPSDKLTLHVRRDTAAYPYFEELIDWAKGLVAIRFGNTNPLNISLLPPGYNGIVQDLNALPGILERINKESLNSIINDFNELGYHLDSAETNFNLFVQQKIVDFKESGINMPIPQMQISAGMFRSFALIAAIFHALAILKSPSLILIDDLCEGLDFDRSTALTKLIFRMAEEKGFQLIATSNDRFLMNAVDVRLWNILKREGHRVKATNYINSKEVFDDFKYKGLNNFDLFTSN